MKKNIIFILFFACFLVCISRGQTITASSVSATTMYAGESLNVGYSTSGTFNTGNVFKLQLSDASGSFTNYAYIGSVTATSSGTITGTIPGNTAGGTGYRVRVVSTSPTVTGSQNSSDITISDIYLLAGEYFYDSDPGVGNGTSFTFDPTIDYNTSWTLDLPNGMNQGFHTVSFRFKNRSGKWSLTDTKFFYWGGSRNSTALKLNAYEYFIDTDTGLGTGTLVNISSTDDYNVSLNINIPDGLSKGMHTLIMRFRNENNQWGRKETRGFYWGGPSTSTSLQITGAEYFFGTTDPGVGNGNGFSIPATDDARLFRYPDVDGLTSGTKYITMRIKNSAGQWGLNDTKQFTLNTTAVPVLSSPANNSLVNSLIPTLSWNTYTGAINYDVQVFTINSVGTATTVYSATAVTNTQVTVPSGLLSECTQYFWYVRAKTGTTTYTDWSKIWNFTPSWVSSVITGAVTNITTNSAYCNGNSWHEGCNFSSRGIVWSTNVNPTLSDNVVPASGTTGSFIIQITGLSQGTNYHARVYATNQAGTVYGTDSTFKTNVANIPTIQASDLSFINVTQTSVCASWTNGNGNKRILLLKTSSFGTSDIPVDGTAYSAGGTFNGIYVAGIYSGSTSSATFTDLSNNTSYYYKMFEYNETGDPNSQVYKIDGFGSTNPNSFKTAPNQINNLLVRSYTKIYIDLEWQRGNGDACMMTCLKGSTSGIINPEYGTTDYSANSTFGSGDGLGTGTPENYVVYKGTGTACRVSGLTRNTQYAFKVYEYNLYNSYYSYATNNSNGNPRTRTTIPKEEEGGEWVDLDNGRIINFKLSPNPANEVLNLALFLEETANITIELFNMDGQNVGTQNVGTQNVGTQNVGTQNVGTHCNVSLPVNSSYQKGQYEIPIAIDKLATGSYYIIVSGNNELVMQDFLIVR